MSKEPNQLMVIYVTLAATAVLSWFLFFKGAVQHDTVDIHNFPKTIGTWTSVDLPLTKDEFEILETHNAFVRLYTDSVSQAQIYLYLVYSQTNRKVAHPPEICYTGNGLAVTEDVHDSIPVHYRGMSIQANRLRLNHGSFTQIAYYWFKVGGHFTSNYWKQQGLIALDTLMGRAPSSALVRISSTVHESNINKAVTDIKGFADMITPDLFKYMP